MAQIVMPWQTTSTRAEVFLGALWGLTAGVLALAMTRGYLVFDRSVQLVTPFGTFGWPAPLVSDFVLLGGPSVIAGVLLALICLKWHSFVAGLVGTVLGCWWHMHLAELSADLVSPVPYMGGWQLYPPYMGPWYLSGPVQILHGGLIGFIKNAEYWFLWHGGALAGIVMLILPIPCALACEKLGRFLAGLIRGGS
jgi:hypothetical protein